MLDHETTLALIKRAQDGDDGAKEQLVKENIPLVKSVVKRFKGRGEYDDLMQLGAIGFLKAIQNFDSAYNVRFSTYAVPMISGEIKRFLRDDGMVKISRWAKTLATKINVFVDEKLKNGEKEPSVDEIALNFGVDREQIVFAMDTGHYLLSLSSTMGDDDVTLEDKIVGDRSPDEDLDKIILKDCIDDLPEREKKVIILRYFRDKTQSEIAAELGVSQVQVSRIECKVLQKLKEKLVEE